MKSYYKSLSLHQIMALQQFTSKYFTLKYLLLEISMMKIQCKVYILFSFYDNKYFRSNINKKNSPGFFVYLY